MIPTIEPSSENNTVSSAIIEKESRTIELFSAMHMSVGRGLNAPMSLVFPDVPLVMMAMMDGWDQQDENL